MKLKYGDMLIMDVDNGTLKLQIIGRNDVPRVEKEGRGWSDGAITRLNGADVAEFLDVIAGRAGNRTIGDDRLVASLEWDDLSGDTGLVLSVKDVSVRMTWSERTLLMYAIRNLAWMLFK